MTLTERANYTKLYLIKISKKYNLTQLLELQGCKQTNPKEYAEFIAYIEKCKAEAKAEMGITED